MPRTMSGAIPRIATLVAALALLPACAPREAGYEVSEAVAAAPPTTLIPTAAFEAPRAEGAAATVRLGEDQGALAARAEALRRRAAALSATSPIADETRARLEGARPEG